MEIIRYFCSVKMNRRFLKTIFKTILLFFALLATSAVHAQEDTHNGATASHASQDSLLQEMDSVDISLLTCSAGSQIWSLYGHTAIRLEDKPHNTDVAINYGMFNFRQKNFILKFVFGHTDYEMGIEPFNMFLLSYASQGRGVVQQRLNLTREEKLSIVQAFAQNYEPANRVYRYNFFYDNCTTRARDILANHLNGKIEYASATTASSYREMIHQWNGQHLWMRFGKDLLLGVTADNATGLEEQQFLPDSLRKDFDKAQIVDPAGHKRPLVATTETILRPNEANVKEAGNNILDKVWNTVTPNILFAAILLLTILMSAFELKRKRTVWLYDVTLLTLDGIAGLALLLMVFSEHPTVNANLQILLLNPLSVIFVYSLGNSAIRKHYHRYWTVLCACIAIFFIGAIFQTYADGMMLLACTLLVRIAVNHKVYLKTTQRQEGTK